MDYLPSRRVLSSSNKHVFANLKGMSSVATRAWALTTAFILVPMVCIHMPQTEPSRSVSRRTFIHGIAVAGGAATAGAATAQSDGEEGGNGSEGENGSAGGNESAGGVSQSGPIDFGGWLEDVGYWNETANDQTGNEEVKITVGGSANNALSFDPVAVHVDPGTKITWEWSGEGGAHNVVEENETFSSGSAVAEAGTTFTQTFEEDGIHNYYCEPHRTQGMKGSVAVGSVPRKAAAAAQEIKPEEMGVPIQPHYVGIASVLMLSSTIVFVFYLLKYGVSPNTKGGTN